MIHGTITHQILSRAGSSLLTSMHTGPCAPPPQPSLSLLTSLPGFKWWALSSWSTSLLCWPYHRVLFAFPCLITETVSLNVPVFHREYLAFMFQTSQGSHVSPISSSLSELLLDHELIHAGDKYLSLEVHLIFLSRCKPIPENISRLLFCTRHLTVS